MKVFSLFSGLMGLDLGFARCHSFEVALTHDNDPWVNASERCNRAAVLERNGAHYDCDFWKMSAREAVARCGRPVVVIGGPPCQSFSTAGRRRGGTDDLGLLLFGLIEFAKETGAPHVVVENVRGLLSAKMDARSKPGSALRTAVQMLEEAKYQVTFDLYDTANYGVPQRRERLLLFASKEGKPPRVPPTHYKDGGHGLEPWETVMGALLPCPARCTFAPFRDGHARAMSLLSQGQNWRDLPKAVAKKAMKGAYASGGGKTGYFRRLSWHSPAPTLVSSPAMPATMLAHPSEDRPLSVEEYLRLQTFPDDWSVCGPVVQQYRQIGNAVPPVFAEKAAHCLQSFVLGRKYDDGLPPLSRYQGTSDASWREKGWL